ncbi:MAG: putative signal transducing protein, partial [Myxococcaceae bacterium]
MTGDHGDGGDLVIVARCADVIEAASLRMFFDSRGLYCLVQGEHHAAGFGELPEVAVLVREADLDEASRLLELFRQGTPAVEEEPEEAPRPTTKRPKRGRPDEGRRYSKRIGVVIIVSLSLTFGCGHFYVGARKRGLALLVLELLAGVAMFGGEEWGGALVFGCILTDMIGASLLITRRR